MIRVIRSENLKIFTTKVWWGMLIGLALPLLLALTINSAIALADIEEGSEFLTPQGHAANLYTSGQYLGVLVAAILGALLMTNEYKHQTLTGTFLATPQRLRVVFGKLFVIMMWGIAYALIVMAIAVPTGMGVLSAADVGNFLDDSDVLIALLMNFVAFAVWAAIGFGVGSMFRSQAGAIVMLIVAYFVTSQVIQIVLLILAATTDSPGWMDIYWFLPNGATSVMTSAGESSSLFSGGDELGFSSPPEWWVGLIVLLGYAVLTAGIGMILTLTRDV